MLLAAPIKTFIAAAAIAASQIAASILMPVSHSASSDVALPELVTLAPGAFLYFGAGEFLQDGKPVDAPKRVARQTVPLNIMKFQVTQQDYQRCVDDGICAALSIVPRNKSTMPAVMVNWHDATAYADWLSHKLGRHYRLPTDEEWTFAAASRAPTEAPKLRKASDPIARWLARYEAEIETKPVNQVPMPPGSFGVNENGLADLSGNIWEWTSTCYTRSTITDTGPRVVTINCGVRAAEGRHRAFVTDFIRDARGGGCAGGVPPSNLGFRLVRDS